MSELSDYGKELRKLRAMESQIRPCAFGANMVIEVFWSDQNEERVLTPVAFCTKARQIKDSFWGGKEAREKNLRDAGCPQPYRKFLSGWKCKYADGQVHYY